jgi:hypothetical protein
VSAITRKNSISAASNDCLPGNDRLVTPITRSPTTRGRQTIDRSPSAAVSRSG